MRKLLTTVSLLICMLALTGCITTDELYGSPVFETENITHITFYHARTSGQPHVVPQEDMQQITAWLGSFTIGPKLVGEQPAGLNYESVKIEYADGSVVETHLDTRTINGVTYYTEHGETPECYQQLVGWAA